MKDNEIIKALKLCSSEHLGCEDGCPYIPRDIKAQFCSDALKKDALDLINRLKVESKGYRYKAQTQKGELARLYKQNAEQQAEIERLQHEILSCNTKIEVLQEVKEQLEKDVFNAQMNCDSIAYEYELLKQEKMVVQSEAIKEFVEEHNLGIYDPYTDTFVRKLTFKRNGGRCGMKKVFRDEEDWA